MIHELNERTSDGISVALLWDDETGATYIELETDSEWNRFQVASEVASDAFSHPFCYLTLSANPNYPYAGELASAGKP